jgi:hypothetical protein
LEKCLSFFTLEHFEAMEQHVLDTNAGKQQSLAAIDVLLTLGLKK